MTELRAIERAMEGRASAVSPTLSWRGLPHLAPETQGSKDSISSTLTLNKLLMICKCPIYVAMTTLKMIIITLLDNYPNGMTMTERDRDIVRSTSSVGGVRRSSPPVIEQVVDKTNVWQVLPQDFRSLRNGDGNSANDALDYRRNASVTMRSGADTAGKIFVGPRTVGKPFSNMVEIKNVETRMVKSGGTGRIVENSVEQTVGFECSGCVSGIRSVDGCRDAAPTRDVSFKYVGKNSTVINVKNLPV